MRQGLGAALETNAHTGAPITGRDGTLYAARNVLAVWPAAASVWRVSRLSDVLAAALGPRFGLVRGLFFDKPPDRTWALPWHKDATIAVRDNRQPSGVFAKPTLKAGVPYVEAPRKVLERRLTARIHLDPMTEANGPLHVLPGTHLTDQVMPGGDAAPVPILGGAGDVLLMRPLLSHTSGRSAPDTVLHRRVLHLEFAADPELPDGYEWHTFMAAD